MLLGGGSDSPGEGKILGVIAFSARERERRYKWLIVRYNNNDRLTAFDPGQPG